MIEAQLQHSSISESQEATAFLVPNKSLVCCSLLQSACWGQPAVEGLRLHCHSLHFTLLVLQHRLYMSLWCVFRSLTAQMVRLVLQGDWSWSRPDAIAKQTDANTCKLRTNAQKKGEGPESVAGKSERTKLPQDHNKGAQNTLWLYTHDEGSR